MKIYVGNLPWSIDSEGLKNLFSAYPVEEASIIQDKFSGKSKGFGFVTIADDEAANQAISEMNGKEIEGRELKISEAKPMDPDRPRPERRSFGGGNRFGGQRRSFGGNSERRSFGSGDRRRF